MASSTSASVPGSTPGPAPASETEEAAGLGTGLAAAARWQRCRPGGAHRRARRTRDAGRTGKARRTGNTGRTGSAVRTVRGGTMRVVWLPGPHGGRLAYFSTRTDASYWDGLWHGVAASYHRCRRGHLPHQLRATFLRWAPPGGRVLEAGCGLAHFTVAARSRGFEAEGIDWAPDTLARLESLLPDVPIRQADVRRLDCPDGSYDVVYSPGVCEHFAEGPEEVLAETYRVLRPGGIAVVSTPCFNSYLLARRRSFPTGQPFAEVPGGPDPRPGRPDPLPGRPDPLSGQRNTDEDWDQFYQYAFTRDEMIAILRRLGFEIIAVHPYGTVLTLTTWVFPWMSRLPAVLGNALGRVADQLPVLRGWGSSCVWVARRPHADPGLVPRPRAGTEAVPVTRGAPGGTVPTGAAPGRAAPDAAGAR